MLANSAGAPAPVLIATEKAEYKFIHQYMMGEVLGEGAQGKVREALDSNTLRRVAIKRINLRQIRKIRNAEANLKRELAIHRKLKHPNVIAVIEDFIIEEKQKVYIVYEHISGGSLQDVADHVPAGIVPSNLLRRCIEQLLSALAFCHSCGIVHRDIKPSNLLISTEGYLKLADFGVAEVCKHSSCKIA